MDALFAGSRRLEGPVQVIAHRAIIAEVSEERASRTGPVRAPPSWRAASSVAYHRWVRRIRDSREMVTRSHHMLAL